MALAAMKNEETAAHLAHRFNCHPTMISAWEKALINGAGSELRAGLMQWFELYNCHQPHQGPVGMTPDEVYIRSHHPFSQAD